MCNMSRAAAYGNTMIPKEKYKLCSFAWNLRIFFAVPFFSFFTLSVLQSSYEPYRIPQFSLGSEYILLNLFVFFFSQNFLHRRIQYTIIAVVIATQWIHTVTVVIIVAATAGASAAIAIQ